MFTMPTHCIHVDTVIILPNHGDFEKNGVLSDQIFAQSFKRGSFWRNWVLILGHGEKLEISRLS